MYLAGTHPDGGVGIRLLGLLPLAIGLGLVLLIVVLSRKSGRQERINHYRIMQFAARNGMGYRMKVKDPEHPAGLNRDFTQCRVVKDFCAPARKSVTMSWRRRGRGRSCG